jgi:hypothetical protein
MPEPAPASDDELATRNMRKLPISMDAIHLIKNTKLVD